MVGIRAAKPNEIWLLTDSAPQVYMDSGVENTNSAVTALVESGTLKRILAQGDVVFFNVHQQD